MHTDTSEKAPGASGAAPTRLWLYLVFLVSGFAALLLRHRARAIFLGAILPFPYALTTIAAGAVGIPLGETLVGSLGRFPKALLNLALIASGWSLGSSA